MTTLKCESVVLRPFRRADITRQRQYFRDPELAWLDSSSPRAYAEIDVEALLDTEAAMDAHVVRLAIEAEGEYIGFCSLMDTADPDGVLELGINIGNRRYWNRGIGRAVIRLLLAHGFNDLGADEIELTTNSRNRRAIRCFVACGFSETKRIAKRIQYESDWVDMIEMSIHASKWRSSRSSESPCE